MIFPMPPLKPRFRLRYLALGEAVLGVGATAVAYPFTPYALVEWLPVMLLAAAAGYLGIVVAWFSYRRQFQGAGIVW